MEFVKLFEEAGFPPGVVNVVTGYGKDVGTPLVLNVTNILAAQAYLRITSIGIDDPIGYVASVIMVIAAVVAESQAEANDAAVYARSTRALNAMLAANWSLTTLWSSSRSWTAGSYRPSFTKPSENHPLSEPVPSTYSR